MEGKKRPTFDEDWWDSIKEHLREHPEEGFGSNEVKQFIKFCVNKHVQETSDIDKDELKEELLEEIREEIL